ncbi:CDP-diacylglycerol-serine O-phosphatidyltransferase [Globomyces sp. JEL0801]|nr:CDP-diacylglycerol-serine O-phosphatidyltransferase [Globomyces sp. JEL0801]
MSLRTKSKKKSNNSEGDKLVVPREYNTSHKRFSLAKNFQLADFITILNCICGTLSVMKSVHLISTLDAPSIILSKDSLTTDQLYVLRKAFILPFLGMFFDVFDGRGGPTLLGQELDSLSDLISFGVAPAVLGWVVGLRTFIDQFILVLFVSAGLARLARFNVTAHKQIKDANGKQKFFEGLPIPTSLCLVSVMWAWFEYDLIHDGKVPGGEFELFTIDQVPYKIHYWSLFYLFWSVCMVSKTLRVPKP